MRGWAAGVLGVLMSGAPASGQDLSVRQAAPQGEVTERDHANEVRVTFSEPMVALGRIPEPVRAPFFSMRPAVEGTFRWAGTRTLIFKPAQALPFATRFEVTVSPEATAVSGRRLGEPYTFSFTTPTVRLRQVHWERKGGRHDAPVLLALRFNQPVQPELTRYLSLQHTPRKWGEPELPAEALPTLRVMAPGAEAAFQARLAAARAAVSATGVVQYVTSSDPRFKGDEWLVLQTSEPPPPQSALRVWIAPEVRGPAGPETPGAVQTETVELENAFFLFPFRCRNACDPDGYNPLATTRRVRVSALRKAVKVWDVTDPAQQVPLPQQPPPAGQGPEGEEEEAEDYDTTAYVSLEDVGYSLQPARTYLVMVDRSLTAVDGQPLGYTWAARVENWHRSAFSSFGSGHGVWESKGGGALPFHARNLQSVMQWAAPLTADELMPTVRRLQSGDWPHFDEPPPVPGQERRLKPAADSLQSYGIEMARLLSAQGTGLLWAALRDGPPIERAHPAGERNRTKATVVQVTNLGIAVKDSPHNTLVHVTRLDDGRPVEGARVGIRGLDNSVLWSGLTNAEGVALAEVAGLRDPERRWEFRFLVTAEKDGDVAYVGSDWDEGLEPWEFGINVDLEESRPLLRGSVFSDRGVYKLGEEIHFKAILRRDDVKGVGLLQPGQQAQVTLTDSQGNQVDTRTVALNEWGSADWTYTLPAAAPLGGWQLTAKVEGLQRAVSRGFLVAAYRRPDFRVDAELAGESSLAGVTLKGVVSGRYLFGAPMAGQAVRWTFGRTPLFSVPDAVSERFPAERYAFLDEDWSEEQRPSAETLETKESTLDAQGQVALDLATDLRMGRPWSYTLEGEVTDVSRQALAGRTSFRVDPAPWYVGLRRVPYFAEQAGGLATEVVVVDLAGNPVPGVEVALELTQVQWHSARRAEGGGFYTWETERREVEAGEWKVTSGAEPVPFRAPLEKGGYFVLEATASDGQGRSTRTRLGFYALGPGYTAWQRYDHNRIDLIPEKKTYRPGETARIMVKSPWDSATALLTTEREGIRTWRTFALTSTQQTVTVPVGEDDIPNVFVSVLLVKGRSGPYTPEDSSDPGKPAFRLGYARLEVEDAAKRLKVAVTSDSEEYRPAQKARVTVAVTDAAGRGAPSEVTLWAVDYGVLSLTGYRTPDPLGQVYMEKALQVLNQDSRQRMISRRALVPKGGEEGGGGGADDGPGTPVRRDFRVLAFWLGSVVTDANGRAATEVTLPESLTTYRIMAVANDKASRFGSGERELRIAKPVLLRAAFPRFLTLGDSATFGAVVNSQLADKGTAIVTMRSLDPALLQVEGTPRQTAAVPGKGSAEVRFRASARGIGRARIQMTVRLHGESDAFEEVIPVQVVVSPEVVAAYGQARGEAREAVVLPPRVVPGFGGLHLELSSTALVGLGEGARYLYTYPYGCAEQRSSAALSLVLAADLGEAFRLPGIEPGRLKEVAQATLDELPSFQCPGGGFAFWKGQCDMRSPYLTSYVLHVMGRARRLGHAVDATVLENGYKYLEQSLAAAPPEEDRWPSHAATQAFTVKVLAEAGRNVDSPLTLLHGHADRMPVFALAYLLDAIVAGGDKGSARRQDVERRIGNAILPEGGTAHVEELSDPQLLWLWSSNTRSTALALGALTRAGAPLDQVAPLTRWLMQARKDGHWGSTQENATAMEALVDYYRRHEAEVPDFTAAVRLGGDTLASEPFKGRSTETRTRDLAMPELLRRGRAGDTVDLVFAREGTGTLHYAARLTYASADPVTTPMDQGFVVERSYAPLDGGPAAAVFPAGTLVRVTLKLTLPKERRYVAVNDPLPGGFEAVETWFATTAKDLVSRAEEEEHSETGEEEEQDEPDDDWLDRWLRGGFDHVERHDDRVQLFATRLSEGVHTFSYVVRATTAGTFQAGPARAEEMYQPEVFGRTATATIEVKP